MSHRLSEQIPNTSCPNCSSDRVVKSLRLPFTIYCQTCRRVKSSKVSFADTLRIWKEDNSDLPKKTESDFYRTTSVILSLAYGDEHLRDVPRPNDVPGVHWILKSWQVTVLPPKPQRAEQERVLITYQWHGRPVQKPRQGGRRSD